MVGSACAVAVGDVAAHGLKRGLGTYALYLIDLVVHVCGDRLGEQGKKMVVEIDGSVDLVSMSY